jgi:hypothetical protein
MAMYFNQLAKVVNIMAVNKLQRLVLNHCVNGYSLSALRRNNPNTSVNGKRFSVVLRFVAKPVVNGSSFPNHSKNVQERFLKQAAIIRQISNDNITQFLIFLRLLSKTDLKFFRPDFRNDFKVFPNQKRRNSAPGKKVLEIHDNYKSPLIGRESA